MRRTFADELYKRMEKNDKIFLLVGDLGYKMWDDCFRDFPKRCVNTGAAEQSLSNIAVGLAQDGKIPFIYTITPFFLRGFETLRTYINHENVNVKLVGSGRDDDYKHDGFSHDATDIKGFFDLLPNITQHWPMHKNKIPTMLDKMITNEGPDFISLKR